MIDEKALQNLKNKLQSLGALRPEAWAQILKCMLAVNLQENESFIREAGTLAFVSSGLLKEYDARYRTKPSIVNFINDDCFFLNYKNTQSNYIRACAPSLIYFIQWAELEKLYQKFKELKTIYDTIAEGYNDRISFRQFLLEKREAKARIHIFINTNRAILPLLKKKDIANYLHLEYNHFVRQYSNLL